MQSVKKVWIVSIFCSLKEKRDFTKTNSLSTTNYILKNTYLDMVLKVSMYIETNFPLKPHLYVREYLNVSILTSKISKRAITYAPRFLNTIKL